MTTTTNNPTPVTVSLRKTEDPGLYELTGTETGWVSIEGWGNELTFYVEIDTGWISTCDGLPITEEFYFTAPTYRAGLSILRERIALRVAYDREV